MRTVSHSSMIRAQPLFLTVLFFGCSTDLPLEDRNLALSAAEPTPQPTLDMSLFSPELREFHGEDHLLTLLYPDRVESYRLSKVGDRSSPHSSEAGADYRTVGQGPDLTKTHIEHLRPLIVDMRGYSNLRRKEHKRYYPSEVSVWSRGCIWKPGVLLRFHRGDTSIGVGALF